MLFEVFHMCTTKILYIQKYTHFDNIYYALCYTYKTTNNKFWLTNYFIVLVLVNKFKLIQFLTFLICAF